MALPATLVWEVQTGGSDSAGGGFDPSVTSPGTDYTQGAGQATFAYTDLVVDGTTNTKVTSAARAFVAADVGNTIQVTSGTGWATGFYNIRSVASGAATLDRSSAAVSTTGGNGTLGGAMASPGKVAGAMAAGNKVWLKGAFSLTTTSTNVSGGPPAPAVGSSGANRTYWRGYSATRGDAGTASITAAVGSIVIFNQTTGTSVDLIQIVLDGGGLSSVTGVRGQNNPTAIRLLRCQVTRCALISSSSGALYPEFVSCTINVNTGDFGLSNGSGSLFFCTLTGNSGFMSSAQLWVAVGNLSYGNTGNGLNLASGTTTGSRADRNTCYNNTGDGIRTDGNGQTAVNIAVTNNICTSNGGYGIGLNGTNGDYALLANNATYNNTSGGRNSLLTVAENNVALTADPFVNAAAGNFALNSTAGGGAACKAAGVPGAFPGGLTTGYPDIGAAQSKGGGLISVGFDGGFTG